MTPAPVAVAPARTTVAGRLARNMGWNAAALVLQAGSSLLVIPLLIRQSGEELFGLFGFLTTFVIVGQFVQLVVATSVTRAVAEHRELGDDAALRGALRYSTTVASGLGLLLAAVVVAVAATHRWWHVAWSPSFAALSATFAASLLLGTPGAVIRGALAGREMFLRRNVVETAPLLLGALVVGLASWHVTPGGVVTYVVVVEAARLLLVVVLALPTVRRDLPGRALGISFARPPAGVAAFQVKQLVNQTADVLYYTADRLIVQAALGAVAVAHYAVADRPNALMQNILAVPLTALVPPVVAAVARGDRRFVERALFDGTRLYAMAALPACVALVVFAPTLIELWVGPGFGDAATVARIFLIGLAASVPFKVYGYLRLAEGSIGAMSAVKLAYAPVNVAASIALVSVIGLPGVAVPTAAFWIALYPATWLLGMRRRGLAAPFLRVFGVLVALSAAHMLLCAVISHLVASGPAPLRLLSVGVAFVAGVLMFVAGQRRALASLTIVSLLRGSRNV